MANGARQSAPMERHVAPSDHPVRRAIGSRSAPLPTQMQRSLGPLFGHDFSRIRLHTDAPAAMSARALHAAAYTIGDDIVFGEGRYQPGTFSGRRLLAHELAHVVQQRFAVPTHSPAIGKRGGPHEREARGASLRAAVGLSAGGFSSLPVQAVQRADEDELKGLESGIPQQIGSTIMGDTGWRFTVAVMQGIAGGLHAHEKAGDVTATVTRFHELHSSWSAIGKFYGGYLWGLGKGIISPVVDLWNLIKGAIQLQVQVTDWIVNNAVELFKGSSTWTLKAQELHTRLKALRDRAMDAVKQFLENPAEGIKQIKSWLDSMMQAALAKARELGHGAADRVFAFLALDWFDMGKEIGTVIGTVLVQVLMAVFTAEIGNALSAAGKALGSVGSWVLGKLGTVFSAVRSLVGSVIKAIEGLASSVLKFIEGLANEIKGLLKWLLDLLGPAEEADLAVAGGGKGTASLMSEAKSVGIPAKLPPGARTNPVTVAQLRRPTAPVATTVTSPPKVPPKVETVDEYLARGGKIQKVPPGESGSGAVPAEREPGVHTPPDEPPVGVEPRARGYAIEDAHMPRLEGEGYQKLPDWFKTHDAYRGGNPTIIEENGQKIVQLTRPDVVSVKSTQITNPSKLYSKVADDLEVMRGPYEHTREGVRVVGTGKKTLDLVFDLDIEITPEMQSTLQRLEREAGSIRFRWFVTRADGIKPGPSYLRSLKLPELD